jgi:ABC-2 type transport system permease protein
VSEVAAVQGHPAVLFAPDPGAAPLGRMITAQATLETRTLLRNGEQLILTLIIPLLLLTAFSLEPLINFGTGLSRINFLTPGIIALAVMSTAFTSQAIATGFERRYGVLKRLGASRSAWPSAGDRTPARPRSCQLRCSSCSARPPSAASPC